MKSQSGRALPGGKSSTPSTEFQCAAFFTGLAFARQLAGLTARYSERLSDVAMKAVENRTDAAEVAAFAFDEYQRYLANLAGLPRIYGLRFLAELERAREARR